MLSSPKPSLSPNHSPSSHPSPKPQLPTLSTDRTLLQSPKNDRNSLSARVSPSPTDRNRTKIRLVSPLRNNKSNLTTKENSPTQINPILKVASPNKHNEQVELGGNFQRQQHKKFNQISNISIKEHLEAREKKNFQDKTATSNKYSAFVIMGSPQQVKTVQRVTVSPFKKQQGPLHITINNKHFDVPSLKSQIIHVAPFQHLKSDSFHAQVIKEETENSSLKDSCDVGLKEIKEMRRVMEIESSRLRETLKTSRINQEACVSRLEFATEVRNENRSPSKLFNFQDVPLQQSRLKVEEKQEKLAIVHESCTKITAKNVISSENQQNYLQAECKQSSLPSQSKEIVQQQNKKRQSEQQRASLKEPCINSQQTLINELHFVTNKRLTGQHSKDSVCVQTSMIGNAENTERRKLAIVRNQECFISIVTKGTKPVEEKEEKVYVQVKQLQQVKVEEDNQEPYQIISEKFLVFDQQKVPDLKEKLDEEVKEEQVSLMEEQQPVPNQQKKEEQIKKAQAVQCHPSVPSIASEIVFVQLKQSQVKSSHSHSKAQSNLSLQLQNPDKNPLQQSNIPKEQTLVQVPIPVLQKIQLANSEKDLPGFMSLRSARSSLGQDIKSKRGTASKRSIHNGIYL